MSISTLAEQSASAVREALSGAGLWFDYGAASIRVRSDSEALASQLQGVYRHFPFRADPPWADLHVDILANRGLRRWWAPQSIFRCDGLQPFDPFPAASPLPLLEWGSNWLIGRRIKDMLLLHAGALERDGLALLLPATPGSGKSTLTAALSLRGWRLLSDEFGAYELSSGSVRAMLKPIALKNASIDVVQAFSSDAQVGPSFPGTRKGTVAHLSASRDSVMRCHEPARPGAVILPKWIAGSVTTLEPVSPDLLFPALAFNAFNYTILGAAAFDAAVQLSRDCLAWTLVYSDLDDAIRAIDRLWAEVVAHQAGRPESP